jgi:hypothetical protein
MEWVEGSGCALMKGISQHLPRDCEENHEKISAKITTVLTDI